ncbi:MAG: hypothetical protein AAGG45_07715 [Pseudomonadota bacterium]
MIVAGLDMATATGVCLGEPGQVPTFWTEDLGGGKPHSFRFANALRLARKLIADHGVQAIGIEAPIIVPKRDKKSTNLLLMGLVANVQGWAEIKGIPCPLIEVAEIDKTFLGWRQASGREARKQAIWSMCKARGWAPQTQDEADAASAWDTMCVRLSPSYAARSGSLLSGRVG